MTTRLARLRREAKSKAPQARCTWEAVTPMMLDVSITIYIYIYIILHTVYIYIYMHNMRRVYIYIYLSLHGEDLEIYEDIDMEVYETCVYHYWNSHTISFME